jgi:Membrane protein involved in colicin uptake
MSTEGKETKNINKQAFLIVLVILLALIVAGGVYYIIHQKKQMEDLVQTFDLDKEMLEDEYNQLSLQYEGYKFSVKDDSLVALLTTEQAKVQRLLEELRTVKTTNAARISELKKELATLRNIMRSYVIQIDSLNTVNEQLKQQNKDVTQKYQQASSTAAKLTEEKEKLTERVVLASRLDAVGITVTPVNKRGRAEKKINNMAQFVVKFIISKNITAPAGEKTIYIRVMKPDDDVLVKNNSNVFPFEGREISYSMRRVVEYEGEEMPVTMYWDIEEFLSPGTYRVDLFADGNLIGKKTFDLAK